MKKSKRKKLERKADLSMPHEISTKAVLAKVYRKAYVALAFYREVLKLEKEGKLK